MLNMLCRGDVKKTKIQLLEKKTIMSEMEKIPGWNQQLT